MKQAPVLHMQTGSDESGSHAKSNVLFIGFRISLNLCECIRVARMLHRAKVFETINKSI